MGFDEEKRQSGLDGISDTNSCTSTSSQKLDNSRTSGCSTDKDLGLLLCRVCHCAESDRRGDAALDFLDIAPPISQVLKNHYSKDSSDKLMDGIAPNDVPNTEVPGTGRTSRLLEFVSPEGEVFVCSADEESGLQMHQDTLIDLGCSCKNDLALAHYACALKWFIGHGSTICEICGTVAKNVRVGDFRKVMTSLKDYETLSARTATGVLDYVHAETNSGVDPDAVAAIRRQRLSEISLWFNPQYRLTSSLAVPLETVEQLSTDLTENDVSIERPTSKRALESTGMLLASCLLILILTWIFAPRVGKIIAKIGLYIPLLGLCASAVVIFLRFVLRSTAEYGFWSKAIWYGQTRYWTILVVFWFLEFGVWASRSRHIHSS